MKGRMAKFECSKIPPWNSPNLPSLSFAVMPRLTRNSTSLPGCLTPVPMLTASCSLLTSHPPSGTRAFGRRQSSSLLGSCWSCCFLVQLLPTSQPKDVSLSWDPHLRSTGVTGASVYLRDEHLPTSRVETSQTLAFCFLLSSLPWFLAPADLCIFTHPMCAALLHP